MSDWSFPLKHVRQEDNNGCTIACVATVCEVTYYEARKAMFPKRESFRDDSSIWGTHKRILSGIRRLGFNTREADTYDRCRRPAILSFAWEPTNPRSVCHSMVWDPSTRKLIDPYDGVLDPWHTERQVDLWWRTNWCAIVVTGRL